MIKLDEKKLGRLKTGSQHLEEKYGPAGSPSRVEFEAKAKAWYYAELLRDERKRYLHIHPTEEWRVQPNLATPSSTRTSSEQVPEQVPEQARDLLHTNNPLIKELIETIGDEELSISQLMEKAGLKHRPNYIEYHLNPAIAEGYVRLLYPDTPHHPRQKYLLTVKGMALYKELQTS